MVDEEFLGYGRRILDEGFSNFCQNLTFALLHLYPQLYCKVDEGFLEFIS